MATKKSEAISRERMRGKADIHGPSIQARFRLESEEVGKSTLIREWQDKTIEQPSVGSGGVISRLFNGCVSLLRSILKCSKGKGRSDRDYMQLQESLVALILWSEDHHLSSGNLDTQMHNSEDLRELICSLLLSLADLLVNGLLQHMVASPAERHANLFKYDMLSLMHEAGKEVSIVETPVDYTRDNVPNMAATLGTLVDCLISLNPSLDDSKDQPGYLTVIEDRPPYHYHMELIASKFPNASRPLLERLGKCNWERYLRLQDQIKTVKDEESVQVGDIESKSRFDDSALGTSVPAQSEFGGSVSTYAETVVSSRAASCHQKLPKLPKDGRNGKRFICQVCNRVVAIRYSRDWKKHVFQDLLAYTCVYDGCSADVRISLWEDRLAMTNHLAAEHSLGPDWKSHPCPLCGHHTGEGKESISLHISRHMEEIALNALPSGYESDSESVADSTVTDSRSTSGQRDVSKTSNSIKSESLPEHEDDPSKAVALNPDDEAQHPIFPQQAMSIPGSQDLYFDRSIAPHSIVDLVTNSQLDVKSPTLSTAGISSPNAESSNWNSRYQNRRSASVSTAAIVYPHSRSPNPIGKDEAARHRQLSQLDLEALEASTAAVNRQGVDVGSSNDSAYFSAEMEARQHPSKHPIQDVDHYRSLQIPSMSSYDGPSAVNNYSGYSNWGADSLMTSFMQPGLGHTGVQDRSPTDFVGGWANDETFGEQFLDFNLLDGFLEEQQVQTDYAFSTPLQQAQSNVETTLEPQCSPNIHQGTKAPESESS